MAGKDKTLQVKVYPWQLSEIDAAAGKAGKTRSDWCREAIEEALRRQRQQSSQAA